MSPTAFQAASSRLVDEGSQLAAQLLGSAFGFLDVLSPQGRLLQLETALPHSALIPERAHIVEQTDAPFHIEIEALSTSAYFDLAALIGQQITLRLRTADSTYRPWHGYVTEASQLGGDGGLARYRLLMRPWLAFLQRREDSFLFQDKTALQVIEEVFRDHPQAHWRVEVSDTLRVRSICTQYQETDFDFISRLLAEEGLSYHFEHLDGDAASDADARAQARHCLVIRDTRAERPSFGAMRFAPARDSAERGAAVDTLTRFAATRQVVTNAVTRGSWDYKRLAGVAAEERSAVAGELPPLEHYDGSGAYRYENTAHAQRAATLALQAHEQHALRYEAQGTVRGLEPGQRFELVEHGSLSGDYLALRVEHEAVNNLGAQAARLTGRSELDKGSYRSRLLAQPADVPVLPAQHPRPTAHGTQTALVVGLDGEAITTERDLRVKLQFHWQRGQRPNPGGLPHDDTSALPEGNAPGDERSGAWVRVAQPAAGANWGAVFVPRIGTEVVVDFVEGDIDRPVVTRQLHNGRDTPPFAAGVDSGVNHPGVISGVHSPTLDRGGYNEWTLDDATGQLRMRLLCSYAASEIGLGHLIQQAPAQGQRGSARGAGFEVTTQGWGSLRAAQGLLISTSARAGTYGSAESTQMDAAEAVAQLKAAQDLGERLNGAAQVMKAQVLKPHEAEQSLPRLIRSVDPQQDGKHEGTVNGQDARKADSQRQPTDPVERPATPTVLIDSASAMALTSEASIATFAGQDQAWVSQGDWQETAAHTASVVAGRTASWYTHDNGIQVKAANGPVSLRAHTDRLEILADQAVQVVSVNDEISISAKTKIELVGGDSSVVLDGGDITFKTPGSFTVKAATHDWQGAASARATLDALPMGSTAELIHFIEIERKYNDGSPVQGAPVQVRFEDGSIRRTTLGDDGQARIDGVHSGLATVEIGEDQRAWQPDPVEESPANPAYGRTVNPDQAAALYALFFGGRTT
ncbi:type VI secretion system Vgr family protein [Ideonella sp. BN130291]|uniref:type VI secretion system Vgr family protein n=1 Tax=Ideonella sp. BN130291 TaxID=3112940 RepID=UPI002E25F767|nr:type VI secretion system Vgr family protein [Ideonella sp. BN130291]